MKKQELYALQRLLALRIDEEKKTARKTLVYDVIGGDHKIADKM